MNWSLHVLYALQEQLHEPSTISTEGDLHVGWLRHIREVNVGDGLADGECAGEFDFYVGGLPGDLVGWEDCALATWVVLLKVATFALSS